MGRLVAAATSCGGEDPGAVGARVAALGGKILFALKHSFGSMDSVHVKYLSSVRLYVKLKKLFGLKDGASLCAIRHLWTGQQSILWDRRQSGSYLAREAPLLRCYVT